MADHLKEKETVWIANWRAYNIRHIIFNSSYRERNSESPSERERTPKITIGSIEYCVVLSIKIGQSEMEGTKCWPLCFPIMFDTGATVSLAPAFKPNEKKKVKGNWRTNLKLRKNIIITGTETAKKNVQLDCSLIPFNYFVLNRTGLVNLRARRTLSHTKQKFRHNNQFGVGIVCAQQLDFVITDNTTSVPERVT